MISTNKTEQRILNYRHAVGSRLSTNGHVFVVSWPTIRRIFMATGKPARCMAIFHQILDPDCIYYNRYGSNYYLHSRVCMTLSSLDVCYIYHKGVYYCIITVLHYSGGLFMAIWLSLCVVVLYEVYASWLVIITGIYV